ncbi:MAG: hypothetical protein JW990_11550 [Thermoleophilia bacterium]|nr:hypothetical protein [Thermoleophilia bacterium]
MAWGVFCYIFGAIAVIGPLCLVWWYWKAAREKFRELGQDPGEGSVDASGPGGA